MARTIILTLHRNDLRLTDNALFHCAHEREQDDVTHVLPLFVFDERFVELSGLPGYEREGPEARTRLCKFWRTGAFRARCVVSSATALACTNDSPRTLEMHDSGAHATRSS